MRFGRALRETLRFEAVWKLLCLCLFVPLLRALYRSHVASAGLRFNAGLLGMLLDPLRGLLFLGLFFAAAALTLYEYGVVVNIASLCRKGEAFTLGQVMRSSLWGLGALRGWSLWLGAAYYVLLLPLVRLGYAGAVVPRVSIPEFVFEELRKTPLGQAGILALYLVLWSLHLLLIFVPVRMALGREGLGAAARGSLRCWRETGWRRRLAVLGILAAWERIFSEIARFWRRIPLGNDDFDRDFLRFLLYSEAFRKDLLYWLLMALLTAAGMACFVWVLTACAEDTGVPGASLAPPWSGDGAALLDILDRRRAAFRDRWRGRLRTRRWRAACGMLCLLLAAGLLAGLDNPPLVHRPFAIAHRGGEGGVENTLEAVLSAQAAGMDYAEIDVQLTLDGVPVLFHDGNLRRLAGRGESVETLRWAELREIPIEDHRWPGAGGRVPSLEEVLAALSEDPEGMGLLIELKPSGGNGAELAEAVISLVEQYGFGRRAMFMSLDYLSLLPILDRHPEWWTGFCAYGAAGDMDEAVWQYNVDFLAVEESLASNHLAIQARDLGLPVYVWSVYDSERMSQYLEMGISGIITDYPGELARVLPAYRASHPGAAYRWTGPGFPEGEPRS